MTRFACRSWIVVVCIALVAVAAASPAAGFLFEGVLVPLVMLFALAVLAVVPPPPQAPRPLEACAGVLTGRAPPALLHLL
jgi:hypothetical protein